MELTKEQQLQELQAIIEELQAENAELRKDKNRLEWVENNQSKLGTGDHVCITNVGGKYWMATFRTYLKVVVKPSYRECVDAAMAKENASPEFLKG